MSEGIPYKSREYLGKYRGVVQENEDPEQLGRVRAKVPSIFGEELLSWAYPVCIRESGLVREKEPTHIIHE